MLITKTIRSINSIEFENFSFHSKQVRLVGTKCLFTGTIQAQVNTIEVSSNNVNESASFMATSINKDSITIKYSGSKECICNKILLQSFPLLFESCYKA